LAYDSFAYKKNRAGRFCFLGLNGDGWTRSELLIGKNPILDGVILAGSSASPKQEDD